ncbi:uncharacterized protein N7482_002722 [Penicillium canariense]|uniref:DUF7702 domain-containing protein n=1 Tax=Penicillium canariense TaxID=189055 RepID=A0A9W9IJC5_9EURO|nr:uncharacterized protein N7482_002722 [Penicillium canariense]KAJ5176845.1 hypothetical protein N7482_002722 [Penicillium canariense]
MGHVTFSDGVAIVMLVFYTICLPFAVKVCLRHGLARSSGWIFLAIFSIIRIVSCSAQLATITQGPVGTPATIAAVTSALGVSPLLLASLGLISRICFSMLKSPWNTIFSFYILRIIQTPCAIGLILCIVAATNASSAADIYQQDLLRAGVILFFVVLVALSLLYVAAAIGYQKTGRGERQLVIGLGASLPFLLVRIIFSLVECFGSHAPGSILASNPSGEFLQLFLANLEEMGVTLIYILTGMAMRSVPEELDRVEHTPTASRRLNYRSRRGDFGGGRLGKASLLVELASAAFQGARKNSHSSDAV